MPTPLNNSLLRGFAVLRLMSEHKPELTAIDLVGELGMNAATAHRFLTSLEEAGALTSVRRGVYTLGHQMIEFGRLAESANPLATIVQPSLQALSAELNESAMACRFGRTGAICIATAISARPITVSIRVGEVLEFPSTAQGKIWLSSFPDRELAAMLQGLTSSHEAAYGPPYGKKDLDDLRADVQRVRSKGYALNLGECEPDIAAVAVPVKNKAGEIVLTMSVFGMLSRFDDALIGAARAKLRAAADSLTATHL